MNELNENPNINPNQLLHGSVQYLILIGQSRHPAVPNKNHTAYKPACRTFKGLYAHL